MECPSFMTVINRQNVSDISYMVVAVFVARKKHPSNCWIPLNKKKQCDSSHPKKQNYPFRTFGSTKNHIQKRFPAVEKNQSSGALEIKGGSLSHRCRAKSRSKDSYFPWRWKRKLQHGLCISIQYVQTWINDISIGKLEYFTNVKKATWEWYPLLTMYPNVVAMRSL